MTSRDLEVPPNLDNELFGEFFLSNNYLQLQPVDEHGDPDRKALFKVPIFYVGTRPPLKPLWIKAVIMLSKIAIIDSELSKVDYQMGNRIVSLHNSFISILSRYSVIPERYDLDRVDLSIEERITTITAEIVSYPHKYRFLSKFTTTDSSRASTIEKKQEALSKLNIATVLLGNCPSIPKEVTFHQEPRGGNCAFTGIVNQLTIFGIIDGHCNIRLEAAQYVLQNISKFKHFLGGDNETTANCAREHSSEANQVFKTKTKMADPLILQAIADLFRLSIKIFSINYVSCEVIEYKNSVSPDISCTCYLLCWENEHYDTCLYRSSAVKNSDLFFTLASMEYSSKIFEDEEMLSTGKDVFDKIKTLYYSGAVHEASGNPLYPDDAVHALAQRLLRCSPDDRLFLIQEDSDGHCGFKSIARQLELITGEPKNHFTLRKEVREFVQNNRTSDIFISFLSEDLDNHYSTNLQFDIMGGTVPFAQMNSPCLVSRNCIM